MEPAFTAREYANWCGMTERSAQRFLAEQKIPFVMEGRSRLYHSKDLTPDAQQRIVKGCHVSTGIVPVTPGHNSLVPASLAQAVADPPPQGLREDLLKDSRVQYCAGIVREASNVPDGCRARKWVEHVAQKHNLTPKTVYAFIAREKHGGLAAHRHTKKNKGKPKLWDEAALEFGIGLALKRQHRKMSEKAIYKALKAEADQRGWAVGGYRSFTLHLAKRLNPLLLALRDGGTRALDNILPPILRSYADLEPFEIVCGDQHKFDFWVQDDDTGAIFRPEGYFFVDLRTRGIYGLWLGKRYNSYGIGLALRFGCRFCGAFKSVYSDNGRLELSRYISGIVNEITLFGGCVGEEIDLPVDLSDEDPEEAACSVLVKHRRAIVKNAKAKLIESFFRHFEALLRDEFKVPGHVKRLSASGEEQEIDELEIKKLAQAGKLLKFSDFLHTVFEAARFYNQKRPHRGVLKEWAWNPRPPEVTPSQCLTKCYEEGFTPVRISEEALDLAFLPKETRTVDRGRIRFRTPRADLYEHSALAALHGQQVSIRFDSLDPGWILVYHNSEFICRALPVEYSSMKDMGVALRKIKEKAQAKKIVIAKYKLFESAAPDLTQYPTIPRLETNAKAVREKLETEGKYGKKLIGEPSAEQIEAEIRANEAVESHQANSAFVEVESSGNRPVFENEVDRYKFVLHQEKQGVSLSTADRKFRMEFEAALDGDLRIMWACYKETNEIQGQDATPVARVG